MNIGMLNAYTLLCKPAKKNESESARFGTRLFTVIRVSLSIWTQCLIYLFYIIIFFSAFN